METKEIKTVEDIWEAHENAFFLELEAAGNDKDRIFVAVRQYREHGRKISQFLEARKSDLNRRLIDLRL